MAETLIGTYWQARRAGHDAGRCTRALVLVQKGRVRHLGEPGRAAQVMSEDKRRVYDVRAGRNGCTCPDHARLLATYERAVRDWEAARAAGADPGAKPMLLRCKHWLAWRFEVRMRRSRVKLWDSVLMQQAQRNGVPV